MDAQLIRKKTLCKFDTDAPVYEKTSDGKFCSRVYPAVINKISEASFVSLLDVGCGTGVILSGITAKARLCGIDLSAQMIVRAQQTLKEKVELVVGDAEALPWPQDTFDTVCCTFSFHHYPNPQKVLTEMNRVLKSDGRLIMADPWAPAPLRQVLNAVMQYSKGGDICTYSRRQMERLLGASGFEMRSFAHPTNDLFLLTAQKTANSGGGKNA
jgi:ubiquinone/menaquinone biosynthesis C-methylase UbiE